MVDNVTPPERLRNGELHLWSVGLDLAPASVSSLESLLSPAERQRSDRYLKETDRQRFQVSRGGLRILLGHYLKIPPALVEITTTDAGKPELVAGFGPATLRFNLSHSADRGLMAFTEHREVGVDLERIRLDIDFESVVAHSFAPGEQAVWRALPKLDRPAAFFRGWTRKEAYVKARGVGLSAGLDQFEVSFAPGAPPRLLTCMEEGVDVAPRWCLFDVSPDGDFAAACAVEEGITEVRSFRFPEEAALQQSLA